VTEPITSLPAAVAKNGAIPAPAGSDLTVDGLLAENAVLQRKLARLKAELKRSDDEYAEVTRERDALQKRMHAAALVKVWTNEDGKDFVFIEDIAPALLGIEPVDGDPR
jgi:uncharacterized small protein (DUF1192 family)